MPGPWQILIVGHYKENKETHKDIRYEKTGQDMENRRDIKMMKPQAIYHDTADLSGQLDERQLAAVHAIIVELSAQNPEWSSPLGIQTEDQLWARADHSLDQAKRGIGRDADEVIDDLKRKYAIRS